MRKLYLCAFPDPESEYWRGIQKHFRATMQQWYRLSGAPLGWSDGFAHDLGRRGYIHFVCMYTDYDGDPILIVARPALDLPKLASKMVSILVSFGVVGVLRKRLEADGYQTNMGFGKVTDIVNSLE